MPPPLIVAGIAGAAALAGAIGSSLKPKRIGHQNPNYYGGDPNYAHDRAVEYGQMGQEYSEGARQDAKVNEGQFYNRMAGADQASAAMLARSNMGYAGSPEQQAASAQAEEAQRNIAGQAASHRGPLSNAGQSAISSADASRQIYTGANRNFGAAQDSRLAAAYGANAAGAQQAGQFELGQANTRLQGLRTGGELQQGFIRAGQTGLGANAQLAESASQRELEADKFNQSQPNFWDKLSGFGTGVMGGYLAGKSDYRVKTDIHSEMHDTGKKLHSPGGYGPDSLKWDQQPQGMQSGPSQALFNPAYQPPPQPLSTVPYSQTPGYLANMIATHKPSAQGYRAELFNPQGQQLSEKEIATAISAPVTGTSAQSLQGAHMNTYAPDPIAEQNAAEDLVHEARIQQLLGKKPEPEGKKLSPVTPQGANMADMINSYGIGKSKSDLPELEKIPTGVEEPKDATTSAIGNAITEYGKQQQAQQAAQEAQAAAPRPPFQLDQSWFQGGPTSDKKTKTKIQALSEDVKRYGAGGKINSDTDGKKDKLYLQGAADALQMHKADKSAMPATPPVEYKLHQFGYNPGDQARADENALWALRQAHEINKKSTGIYGNASEEASAADRIGGAANGAAGEPTFTPPRDLVLAGLTGPGGPAYPPLYNAIGAAKNYVTAADYQPVVDDPAVTKAKARAAQEAAMEAAARAKF